jgi:RNA polymerase sigma-70 factor (ECF subfamily)
LRPFDLLTVLRVSGQLVVTNIVSPSRLQSRDDVAALIERARDGSPTALGCLLDGCRKYLLLVANESLDSDLRPKGGASDLVQDTFIEAQRGFVQFKGTSEGELLAWLKAILAHRLANNVRRYATDKRDVDREILLDLDAGWRPANDKPGNDPAWATIDRDEQARLAAAIARLPEPLRMVIEMRTWQGKSFPEIGAHLGKTSEAARKQWGRAVRRLQQELEQP